MKRILNTEMDLLHGGNTWKQCVGSILIGGEIGAEIGGPWGALIGGLIGGAIDCFN